MSLNLSAWLLISLASASCVISLVFFFNDTATTEIYTLSLHDALPICVSILDLTSFSCYSCLRSQVYTHRSEEHTSELQSRRDIVCRLLLEIKKKIEAHTFTDSIISNSWSFLYNVIYNY